MAGETRLESVQHLPTQTQSLSLHLLTQESGLVARIILFLGVKTTVRRNALVRGLKIWTCACSSLLAQYHPHIQDDKGILANPDLVNFKEGPDSEVHIYQTVEEKSTG